MTGAELREFGVGAVLELAEADYLYGTGRLAIRLTEADTDPARYPNMEWVIVSGVPLHPNGATGPVRCVTIRVSAIGRALRAPNWTPLSDRTSLFSQATTNDGIR